MLGLSRGLCGTRVVPTLAQIETPYGDRVKLVLRDYPIDQLHPQARQAHEAARCAQAQGTCWASHEALCAHAPPTSPEPLKASAQEVGLDLPACEPCVSSGTYQATVPQDIDEGTRAGVTGPPAFVITGRGSPTAGAVRSCRQPGGVLARATRLHVPYCTIKLMVALPAIPFKVASARSW